MRIWIEWNGSLYTDYGFQMPIMKSPGPVTESKEGVSYYSYPLIRGGLEVTTQSEHQTMHEKFMAGSFGGQHRGRKKKRRQKTTNGRVWTLESIL